jgi:hypothetical protein
MAILYLSAPGSIEAGGATRTFDVRGIFDSGLAPDYAISANLIAQVSVGMKVVVFDRDSRQQLECIVEGYEPTSKAANGLQRYDIHLGSRRRVPYSNPPKVNHCGVAVG